MNLDFKLDEEDFFKAIGITKEDEEAFKTFQQLYYAELGEKFQSKKLEGKLNDLQLKKEALKLSSYSKMLETALEWWKDYKRKDQLTILLLREIFFKMTASHIKTQDFLKKSQKPKRRIIN